MLDNVRFLDDSSRRVGQDRLGMSDEYDHSNSIMLLLQRLIFNLIIVILLSFFVCFMILFYCYMILLRPIYDVVLVFLYVTQYLA